MNRGIEGGPIGPRGLPLLGCFTLSAVLLLLCLLPVFLIDVLHQALEKLHLSPLAAVLSVLGILFGSLVNLPVHRIDRLEPQPDFVVGAYGIGWFTPRLRWTRLQTIIAVNVGGCVVPTLLALHQAAWLSGADPRTLGLAVLVVLANVGVCYRAARPVPGVGIMMPGLVSPLVSVGLTWLLGVPAEFRPSVAFIAGVAGPLVGADLLHLREISRMAVGVLSIGGAGTFDGIVLSGVLAALLA
jgi:uncharacterized membrane protein